MELQGDLRERVREVMLKKGYIGPEALGEAKPAGIRYLVDPRVVAGSRWITGANQPGRHVFELTAGRDFTADGTTSGWELWRTDGTADCSQFANATKS